MQNKSSETTSWEPVDKWYHSTVGERGHYYHQKVIFPKLFKMINLKKVSSLLDLGCGQGVLARSLPKHISYFGVDLSPSLIKNAKKLNLAENHQFVVGDITQKNLKLDQNDFDIASMILCLQNLRDPFAAFQNAANHLKEGGTLAIVLNHPCFRIPRQSSWQIDNSKKIQYRRIDRYLSPLEIPIDAHPGKKEDASKTFSFHYPLSDYFTFLSKAGFAVTALAEWCSDKQSVGGAAKMENRARNGFPLFLTLIAKKLT